MMAPAAKRGSPKVDGRRCLFCRSKSNLMSFESGSCNAKSCATSLCVIFGLSDDHPFRSIYEGAYYCKVCLEEVQEADITFGNLELLKQSLLRFQNMVYNKLGDNYFQIKKLSDVPPVSYKDGTDQSLPLGKFSYDETVKIIFEKLNQTSSNWESFSSQDQDKTILNIDSNPATSTDTTKADSSTQTESWVSEQYSDNDPAGTKKLAPSYADESVVESEMDVEMENYSMCSGSKVDDNVDIDNAVEDTNTHVVDIIISNDDVASDVQLTQHQVIESTDSCHAPQPHHQPPVNLEEKLYCTFDTGMCNRYFFDAYNLEIHIKSYHEGNKRPYECSTCKKGFVDETHLKLHHIRVHATDGGTYVCEHCGKFSPTENSLRDHIRRHEKEGALKYCGFCNEQFSTSQQHEDHENKHRSKSSPFDCVHCSSRFNNSKSLKQHFSVIHSGKSFTCEFCGKALSSEYNLKTHLTKHTNEFKCDHEQCSFAASSQKGLIAHQLTHSSEKQHYCEICGVAYKYLKNLISHQRVHSGEKPHTCVICSASFREKSSLNRHEATHTAVASCVCPICGKSFKLRENLRKHEKLHEEGRVSRSPRNKLVKNTEIENSPIEKGRRKSGLLTPEKANVKEKKNTITSPSPKSKRQTTNKSNLEKRKQKNEGSEKPTQITTASNEIIHEMEVETEVIIPGYEPVATVDSSRQMSDQELQQAATSIQFEDPLSVTVTRVPTITTDVLCNFQQSIIGTVSNSTTGSITVLPVTIIKTTEPCGTENTFVDSGLSNPLEVIPELVLHSVEEGTLTSSKTFELNDE